MTGLVWQIQVGFCVPNPEFRKFGVSWRIKKGMCGTDFLQHLSRFTEAPCAGGWWFVQEV